MNSSQNVDIDYGTYYAKLNDNAQNILTFPINNHVIVNCFIDKSMEQYLQLIINFVKIYQKADLIFCITLYICNSL